MAGPGEKLTTHTRDPRAVAEAVADWLGGGLTVSEVHSPDGSGMSSVTVLFTVEDPAAGALPSGASSRHLVARLAPEDSAFPVFPDYDLGLQVAVMQAVADSGAAPVPRVVALEPEGSVLGTPFLVMEAITGRAPADNPPYVFGGWLLEATPEERRRLQDSTVSAIAAVHAVPPPAAMPVPEDPLRAHVAGQREMYAWTCGRAPHRIPLLERAFDWLEERWPADPGAPVLCWGDARPGNILFDGFTPAALLDWEMAAVAPREVDLAWPIFLHRFFQDIATVFELPGLPDLFRPDDVVATYQAASGHEVRDLEWYVVYAALRHGIVMSQAKRRMIHFGEDTAPDDPDDYVMHRAALEALMKGTYAWD